MHCVLQRCWPGSVPVPLSAAVSEQKQRYFQALRPYQTYSGDSVGAVRLGLRRGSSVVHGGHRRHRLRLHRGRRGGHHGHARRMARPQPAPSLLGGGHAGGDVHHARSHHRLSASRDRSNPQRRQTRVAQARQQRRLWRRHATRTPATEYSSCPRCCRSWTIEASCSGTAGEMHQAGFERSAPDVVDRWRRETASSRGIRRAANGAAPVQPCRGAQPDPMHPERRARPTPSLHLKQQGAGVPRSRGRGASCRSSVQQGRWRPRARVAHDLQTLLFEPNAQMPLEWSTLQPDR